MVGVREAERRDPRNHRFTPHTLRRSDDDHFVRTMILRAALLAVLVQSCARAVEHRNCRLPWSLQGVLVCEGDLPTLSRALHEAKVQALEIRPGQAYEQRGARLVPIGVMDPRWLRDFRLKVWIHGDPKRRLRSLRGLGSRRLSALQANCAPGQCCDPMAVRGIGPKTVAGWGDRVVVDLAQAPCLWWDGTGFSLVPCTEPRESA